MQASFLKAKIPICFRACLLHSGWAGAFTARRIYTVSTDVKLLEAYELAVSKRKLGASEITKISNILRDIRGSTLSTKEAYLAISVCLRTGYFEPELLRSCLSVVEAGYFSPELIGGWNPEGHSNVKHSRRIPANCSEAINNMSIRDKACLVVWQDALTLTKAKTKDSSEYKRLGVTQDIDPEKRELFTTKKLGKVLDPKPLRVPVRKMAPGKKLCNTVAFQLREAISEASLAELGNICAIFAAKLPLSGQLNDDTMDILASRLCEFKEEELASIIHQIAIFANAAHERSFDTWSFSRASRGTRPSESHRLYNIRRQTLPKKFLEKLKGATCLYASVVAPPERVVSCFFKELTQVEQHMDTVRLLSKSDIPIDMNTWDSLLSLTSSYIQDADSVTLPTILFFFEAVDSAQLYTPQTLDKAAWLLSSKISEDRSEAYIGDTKGAITQMLYFISTHCPKEHAKRAMENVQKICLKCKISSLSHIRNDILHSLELMKSDIPGELLLLIDPSDERKADQFTGNSVSATLFHHEEVNS